MLSAPINSQSVCALVCSPGALKVSTKMNRFDLPPFFLLDNAILFETAGKAHPSFFIIIPGEYRLKCLKSCDLICPFKQGVSFLVH